MKWTYERIAATIDIIDFYYIDDEIDHPTKTTMEKNAFEKSGWTEDEFMTEMEKRLDKVLATEQTVIIGEGAWKYKFVTYPNIDCVYINGLAWPNRTLEYMIDFYQFVLRTNGQPDHISLDTRKD